jgi:UDP-N-acetylglucosamine:LPS N-acetylglucosamine transferase
MGRLSSNPTRVLALASGGGHWVQLLRLRPAWHACDVAYATTHEDYRLEVEMEAQARQAPPPRFYSFPDASRSQWFRLIRQMLAVLIIVLRERPDVVVSTGASAGYFALRIGKLLGCKTIWVDSIANAGELSLAGQRVAPYADLWLTQWEHLAVPTRAGGRSPGFEGAVLGSS